MELYENVTKTFLVVSGRGLLVHHKVYTPISIIDNTIIEIRKIIMVRSLRRCDLDVKSS